MVDTCKACDKSGRVNHKQGPTDNEHQQGYGCLVDFRNTLNGYEKITNYKRHNNGNS